MAREALVAGEALIDFIADSHGPLTAVESFSRRAGGAPASVAVGLARLDRTPWFCTALATDAFGDHLATVLDREGVRDRFVRREPDAQTALAIVSHSEDADREFTFYRQGTADRPFDASGVPGEPAGVPEHRRRRHDEHGTEGVLGRGGSREPHTDGCRLRLLSVFGPVPPAPPTAV